MPSTAPIRKLTQTILPESIWRVHQENHQKRFEPWLGSYLYWRERGYKHPVLDFLLTYYSFKPSLLRRWSPGIGLGLDNAPASEFPGNYGYRSSETGVRYLDPALFPVKRLNGLEWTINLLEQTSNRSPSLGCYGLHEWAMVYKQGSNRRHHQVPLRMKPAILDAFVESQNLVCTHYDAFRFYTDEARPLNRFQPSRKSFPDMEQPGCLHTNMDLYKWAYKFYPWIDSDLIGDCFELAVDIRTVDMKASPYDLTTYGYQPIRIETEEGKAEYREEQKRIADKAKPLRNRLIKALSYIRELI